MTETAMTYRQALEAPPSKKSQDETYNEIVEMVKKRYDGNISDVEAHEAARNLIGFTKVAMEVHEQQKAQ
ncbi:MAG: hypothetical protein AAGB32_00070 [Pseudomonadota bacterium]